MLGLVIRNIDNWYMFAATRLNDSRGLFAEIFTTHS